MTLGVNVDYRYLTGYPDIAEALRYGVNLVRCISLPQMEAQAGGFLQAGIRVIAVYTGESDNAGNYILRNCSALQIGNEPFMDGGASWPTGNYDDFVNVWSHVANVLVPPVHGAHFPLIGPGLWSQDYSKWAQIAMRLPGLSAAAVHVYPGASGHTLVQVKAYLAKYRNVRTDLPLLCTEWTERGSLLLPTAKAIDTYCTNKCWFAWGNGVAGHELYGTPEFGTLMLA